MKHIFRSISLAVGLLIAGSALVLSSAAADEPSGDPGHAHDSTNIWSIARGGQLYDNWMAAMFHDNPKESHPAYPSIGKKRGYPTWRCKECHGWDYKGSAGAYDKNSAHYTGIKGVLGVAGKDVKEIEAIIQDKTHGFTEEVLSHSAIEMLAIFLSQGLIDMDRYIDRQTNLARGNPKDGAHIYQTICAVCHGYDGKEINFKSEKFPEYTGTVCVKNPWEALHKIRFGQPGVGMVALTSLKTQDLVDILAYCQVLPTK